MSLDTAVFSLDFDLAKNQSDYENFVMNCLEWFLTINIEAPADTYQSFLCQERFHFRSFRKFSSVIKVW